MKHCTRSLIQKKPLQCRTYSTPQWKPLFHVIRIHSAPSGVRSRILFSYRRSLDPANREALLPSKRPICYTRQKERGAFLVPTNFQHNCSQARNSCNFAYNLLPFTSHSNNKNNQLRRMKSSSSSSGPNARFFCTKERTTGQKMSKRESNENQLGIKPPTLSTNPEIYSYLLNHLRDSKFVEPVHSNLEVSNLGLNLEMQTPPDQLCFLQFLLKTLHVKKAVEFGTFLGTGLAAMIGGVESGGKIISFELDPNLAQIAQKRCEKLRNDVFVQVQVGKAADLANKMIQAEPGQFDFVYIDANKSEYLTYYEQGLQLVKREGIVAVDNTLFHGHVQNKDHRLGKKIDQLNKRIRDDPRIDFTFLGIGDGLTLCRKI